jgi:hypothetical protein
MPSFLVTKPAERKIPPPKEGLKRKISDLPLSMKFPHSPAFLSNS